ncbi:MAG TPA: acyl carrier protein [Actinomycetota bacterium]|nr:acyl carrier protein [Actinomycetota bacterium]
MIKVAKRDEIFEAIKEHLVGRGIEASKVSETADLQGDLGLDSLDTVEMTVGLEERFDIEIPDAELEGVQTVNDAVELIEKKVAVGT